MHSTVLPGAVRKSSQVHADGDEEKTGGGKRSWVELKNHIESACRTSLRTSLRASLKNSATGRPRSSKKPGLRQGVTFDDLMDVKKIATEQKKARETRMVFLPGSRFVAFWRILVLFLVLWTVIAAPFELAFSWWKAPSWFSGFSLFTDVTFWLDMLLTFFIAPVKHGKLQLSFRARSLSYVKSWLIVDVLTNIPWATIILSTTKKTDKSRKLFKVLKMPKLLRMFRLMRVFNEEAQYLGFVSTFLGIVLMVHYYACFLVWALLDCKKASSPFVSSPSDLKCPDIGPTYSTAVMAGASILILSKGWAALEKPSAEASRVATFVWRGTPTEYFIIAGLVFIGLCATGLLFAQINRSVQAHDGHTREFHKRVKRLREAEQRNKVTAEVYARARKHYHYLWSCGPQEAHNVLADPSLSPDLRCKMALSFYGNYLRHVPFLVDCDEQFMKKLCCFCDLLSFAPEDHIIMAGEFGTDLYFLMIGKVRVEMPGTGVKLRTLVEGSFFGEMGLLIPESLRTVNVIAESQGWLLKITYDSLMQICGVDMLDHFKNIALHRQADNHSIAIRATMGDELWRTSTLKRLSEPDDEALGRQTGPAEDHAASAAATCGAPGIAASEGICPRCLGYATATPAAAHASPAAFLQAENSESLASICWSIRGAVTGCAEDLGRSFDRLEQRLRDLEEQEERSADESPRAGSPHGSRMSSKGSRVSALLAGATRRSSRSPRQAMG